MKVKIINQTEHTALVEWYDGATRRAIIPAGALKLDTARRGRSRRRHSLWRAMGRHTGLRTTAQAIANELRRRGIWTLADLQARPNEAAAALQRVYALDLAALRRAAQTYEVQ